ncbi:NDP-hexose 3,4-dehydratase, putative [Trichomonas vaginalis G3]|uniref:NDP-hexose 3,4-dehydratase, putative n=1 Tax=Trichomonas vaginalis (strain ATCC PRA-98 / G3) TaxID=412133 RepID=A2E9A6_TRIV3|nr:DegT/DnrJ/EryC1/StrS aminotransferase family [Trichomonas vaginalis G3]EAY10791.1 NDP-hexose 3,4-dehydratase, putative [Trichomonas vaginalis G3]KAI5536069.1 DegT/DnrJ/EryC1/StrS aminotransferase family [Trichomonas vaginalis G3]|eukprot:XP_001323014.1 NDP-hexose 3,4-dehydratase [Trichomonas vaginalis G3]
MNAAFGLVQLDRLPQNIKIRHELFDRYIKTLKNNEYASKYYKFPVIENQDILLLALPLECPDRMELIEVLEENEIQPGVTMAGNILRHPIYKEKFPDQAKKQYPVADEVMKNGFLIGCHQGLTLSDVDRVCEVLINFAKRKLFKFPEL